MSLSPRAGHNSGVRLDPGIARRLATTIAALTAIIRLTTAAAQTATTETPCAAKLFRWAEDCSGLRADRGALRGLERLRYIPLSRSGSAWLTLGGEYRLKTEYLDAPDYGLGRGEQAYTAVGERFLAHADLRTSLGLRAFAQLSAATDSGRKPAERPFDRSRPDIAQAFVDVPLPHAAVLRIGRQELDAGGNRLIAIREAGDLRLAFDMAHLAVTVAGFDAVAFYGRPVLNRPGSFDDRGNPSEKFLGGWLQRRLWLQPAAPLFNVFFFERDRSRAVYQQGLASDDRRTLGMRLSDVDAGWDYTVQAARQYGSFGEAAIDAFGAAGDVGWHAPWPGRPRIAASFGYASGDRQPGDRTLGTFDVLYPNLGYFTDAPVYYPGNTADAQPNITCAVTRSLTARAGADVIFRVSKHDAVYGPPGVPVLPGRGTGPSYVTTLAYLRADWRASPRALVSISYVHGDAGTLIRSAGGHAVNYGGLSVDVQL
ncbi:MAG: alginate export family protein [Gammaproteobacteria bacterium]|nr:alginate export family protein [Gammaproteobacteria bacterium]